MHYSDESYYDTEGYKQQLFDDTLNNKPWLTPSQVLIYGHIFDHSHEIGDGIPADRTYCEWDNVPYQWLYHINNTEVTEEQFDNHCQINNNEWWFWYCTVHGR